MDIAIEFFRDTLDGPFYIAWVVVLVILIFACIGYLAEKGIKNKKLKEKYAVVENDTNTNTTTSSASNPVVNETVSDLPTSMPNQTINQENSPVLPANDQVSPIQPSDKSLESLAVTPQVETVNTAPVDNTSNVVIPTINQDENNNSI